MIMLEVGESVMGVVLQLWWVSRAKLIPLCPVQRRRLPYKCKSFTKGNFYLVFRVSPISAFLNINQPKISLMQNRHFRVTNCSPTVYSITTSQLHNKHVMHCATNKMVRWLQSHQAIGIFRLHDNLTGPLLPRRSILEQNIMWYMTVIREPF